MLNSWDIRANNLLPGVFIALAIMFASVRCYEDQQADIVEKRLIEQDLLRQELLQKGVELGKDWFFLPWGLRASDSSITDQELCQAAALKIADTLYSLKLENTNISDNGLICLPKNGQSNIRTLNLNSTNVSNQGLEPFWGNPNIKTLHVSFCDNIDGEYLGELALSLPNLWALGFHGINI